MKRTETEAMANTSSAETLCTTWVRLMEHPEDPSVAAEARERLVDLVQHLEECEGCRQQSENTDVPHLVFEALAEGGIELSEAELAVVRSMDDIVAQDRESIETAVEDVLLRSLPPHLSRLDAIARRLTSLQLFLSTDAVNLLICRAASRAKGQTIQLTEAGLRLGNKNATTSALIVAEIARHASIGPTTASAVWRWVLEAGRYCSRLFLGLTIMEASDTGLMLTLDSPTLQGDLVERWRPAIRPRVPVSVPGELEPKEIYVCLNGAHELIRRQIADLNIAAKGARRDGDTALGRKLDQQSANREKEAQEVMDLMANCDVKAVRSGRHINALNAVRCAEEAKMLMYQKLSVVHAFGDAQEKSITQFCADRLKNADASLRKLDTWTLNTLFKADPKRPKLVRPDRNARQAVRGR